MAWLYSGLCGVEAFCGLALMCLGDGVDALRLYDCGQTQRDLDFQLYFLRRKRTVMHIIFWMGWIAFGYAAWSAWLERACPHAGCSFILVVPKLLELIVPFMVWGAIGVAASIGIGLVRARRRSPTENKVHAGPPPLPDAVQEPVSAEALMRELGITFDGSLYGFREYRYEKLTDAIAYAKLAQRRDG